jgi:hypothetical protein
VPIVAAGGGIGKAGDGSLYITGGLEVRLMEMNTQDIQFVIGAEGKPTAVLVDIETWERIILTLEDAEDVALAREALALLDAAGGDPDKAGFIPWDRAKSRLEHLSDAEQ